MLYGSSEMSSENLLLVLAMRRSLGPFKSCLGDNVEMNARSE